MRSKVTVVLLFLNVVLFAYIYYTWRPSGPLVPSHVVLPPEIASMDSLTRTVRTGEVVKLEKRGESWWLTKPYEWPANPNAARNIQDALQFLKDTASFSLSESSKNGQTLADYGLADPAITLEFTSAGKSFKLLVGDSTPNSNNLYVLSPDGTRIHVVNRSLADSVGLPLADLRNATIFTIPAFEVRSLNLQLPPPSNLKVRLRRDAAARWNFESPILARGAKTPVEVTITALNSLTAKSFLDPHDADPDRTGLNNPALRVTLEGNARRETLLLGNATATAGEYYAKIEDKSVVFTVAVPSGPHQLLEVLRTAQEALRDPRVLDFDPTTVTALTITAPGQPELALQKLESATPAPEKAAAGAAPSDTSAKGPAKEGWQVVTRANGQAPVTLPGDAAVITELLTKLQLLSAHEYTMPDGKVNHGYLSDAPSAAEVERYGFNRAEREITLNLKTGGGLSGKEPSTEVLQVGVSPDEPGKAFARLTNPPFVYEILPDILDETPSAARHYRQRLLRPELPESARLTSLALVDLATNTTLYAQKLKEGDRNWDVILAAEPEAVRPVLAGLLAQLRRLQAQDFAADAFTPDHADSPQGPHPWRYRLDYTIAFNGDPAQGTPSSLLLTERLGGKSQLAGTADFGGVVFIPTQPMIDALFALIYGQKNDPGPVAPAAAQPKEPAAVPPAAKP